MSKRRWAFFVSLKIGVLFQTSNGILYTKLSETQAQRVATGVYQEFAENSIVFVD
jgi:hypothetical protein